MKGHIAVAAQSGMKAGLRAYEESISNSGLEQVQEIALEVFSLPSKQRFKWYCERFGEKVAKAKRTPNTSAPTRTQERPQPQAQESEVARLERELAEAKARAQAKPERTVTQRSVPTGPMIKTIERIAHRRGDKVEVTVKLNGKTLSFAAGSAYIDAAFNDGTLRRKDS